MKTTTVSNSHRKIIFTRNGILVKYDNGYMNDYIGEF